MGGAGIWMLKDDGTIGRIYAFLGRTCCKACTEQWEKPRVELGLSLGVDVSTVDTCLVDGDWNMTFIFPYIGNHHPN